MKKITELLKPFICIIFGALLLLYFLNWLSTSGIALGIGITAVVMSAYYLTVGVLGLVLGDKMNKDVRRILDIVSISFFPLFMFVYFLLVLINANSGENPMGPAGWIISILSIVGSLAFPVVFIISSLLNVKWLQRLAVLFGGIFVIGLVTNILFDYIGNPIVLGNLNIILLVIYAVYTYMLINSLFLPEKAKAE